MKLLTLNCHAWQEENQIEKIQHLAQVIKEKQYDVIALQEVMQLIDTTTSEKVKQDNYAVVLLSELMKLGVNDYKFVWDLGDISVGLMTVFNIIIIVPMGGQALKALEEYEKIRKETK